MAKNDHPHAARLLKSMEKHGRQADGEVFAAKYPLPRSADMERKFAWARSMCAYLEERYPEDEIRQIRMDCACNPENGKAAKLKAVYARVKDPAEFAEKATGLGLGFAIEYGDAYYDLVYPACYCACVKRVPETLPKTWCYCTLGYTKRMFESILEQAVDTELIGSIKNGDSECRIRVRAKKPIDP